MRHPHRHLHGVLPPSLPDVTGDVLSVRRSRSASWSVAAGLVCAIAVLPVAATPAAATVTVTASTAAPVRVVISGAQVEVSVGVVSGTSIATSPVHVVVLQGTGVSLWAGGSSPQLVIHGSLPSRGLALGAQTWTAIDAGDKRAVTVPVLVLRQSRFASVTYTPTTAGQVRVTLRLQHFDPAFGRWAGSRYSPVQVQTWRSGRWAILATLSTDATGAATGIVRVPAGGQALRLQRPEGVTVTGLTSAPVRLH
jgi:hypothetical protein